MAKSRAAGPETSGTGSSGAAWRNRVAVVVAFALAAAGMIFLEHNGSGSASSAPTAVHGTVRPAAPADPQVAELLAVTSRLRGAASLMTQTLPSLNPAAAARTAALASSTNQAAQLSQKLASLAAAKRPDPAQVTSAAGELQAALTATQAQAAAASTAPIASAPIQFCNFTIQIGPFFIRVGRRIIQIGPFFIHFRAPCFLSGRIPTHIP